MSTLATNLATRIDRHLTEEDYDAADAVARIAAMVQEAGLLNTPIPEPEPEPETKPAAWPASVTVATAQTDIIADGQRIGFIMHAPDGQFLAYPMPGSDEVEDTHDTLDAAAMAIIQHYMHRPSTAATEMTVALDAVERAIERGREDQREDELREGFEAEADRIEGRTDGQR